MDILTLPGVISLLISTLHRAVSMMCAFRARVNFRHIFRGLPNAPLSRDLYSWSSTSLGSFRVTDYSVSPGQYLDTFK
jgi:hypothetical protein